MRFQLFNRPILIAALAAFLLASQSACTATRLPPYEATYTTRLHGIKIKGTRKFEATGEHTYKLSWKAKALWMRLDEWSEFAVIDEQVKPISYHYTRKGLGSDRPIHVRFDWENMQVNASKGKKQYQFDLEPGVLDKLSYQVQMQIDLLESPQAETLKYTVANYNGLRDYQFDYSGEDSVKTKEGNNNTLIFERMKRDRKTRLWVSPEHNYLPVKIEQIEDGDSNVAIIQSWKSTKLKKQPLELVKLNDLVQSQDEDDFFADDDF